MSVSTSHLQIDATRAVELAVQQIRALVDERGTRGVTLGLSGGVDSAVICALSIRAVGRDNVAPFYLPVLTNEKAHQRAAESVAQHLGVALQQHNLVPQLNREGTYRSWVFRLRRLTRLASPRLTHGAYRRLFGETPFMTVLRRGEFDGHRIMRWVYRVSGRHFDESSHFVQVLRRAFLEEQAQRFQLLLIGGGNLSEYMTGWFGKNGVDDLEIQPLAHLYKTQVRQLSRHLGLPDWVAGQAAMGGLRPGLTDEVGLGITYPKLDVILDGTECGLSDEAIRGRGVSQKDINLVRLTHDLSEWKRGSPSIPPAMDGRSRGGLRVAPALMAG